jgi:putative salt-induced outer membrane protein YdiY
MHLIAGGLLDRQIYLLARFLGSSVSSLAGCCRALLMGAFHLSFQMKNQKILSAIYAIAALASGAAALADTVGTKDGSTIQGKIIRVSGGVLEIETTFAGVLKIPQANVASMSTDSPVFVRYEGGNTIQGAVSTAAGGEVRVAGPGAWGTGSVGQVAAVWVNPSDSPETKAAEAAKRAWAYEASVDVLGTTGNTHSSSAAVGFGATLSSPQDKLSFYAAYARAVQDGKTSTDNAKGGVDYAAFFTDRNSWYVREEIGTDRIKDLSFYSNTAAGLGYSVIKEPKHELTFRSGLAYRYEDYKVMDKLSTPALDLAILHNYTLEHWRIANKLVFLPSLQDFSNYRIQHDSFIEMPLAASQWKIRIGLSNDYVSIPQPGKEKLDTTYYTKFLLNWK